MFQEWESYLKFPSWEGAGGGFKVHKMFNRKEKEMDLKTLIELLKSLHNELETCINNKQGPPFQTPDPILLGDFIVDAYNNYLNAAKKASENPIIQGMAEIWRLTEADLDYDDYDRAVLPGDNRVIPLMGGNPRLKKMREVALAAKQLRTVLESLVETEKAEDDDKIDGVTIILENLGENIKYTKEMINANPEQAEQIINNWVTKYNQCLEIALEDIKDPILMKMFQPLKSEIDTSKSELDKAKSLVVRLSELQLAQSGLLNYLEKIRERH